MRKRLQKMGKATGDFIWHLQWRGHEIIKDRVAKYGIPVLSMGMGYQQILEKLS